MTLSLDTAVTLPAPLNNNAQFFVFSDWPDMPAQWTAELKELAAKSVRQPLRADFELMAALEQGAPLGAYAALSQRVARVTGIVGHAPGTGSGAIEGAAVSQGWLGLRWREEPEGLFLVLDAHAPVCAGWGEALNTMCAETLNVSCLRQYEKMAVSLIENVANIEHSQGLILDFQGEWTDSTRLLRKKLIQTAVSMWAHLAEVAQGASEPMLKAA